MATTTVKPTKTLTVRLEYDHDCECPIGHSGDKREKIVSFSRRHDNFVDPEGKYFDLKDGKPVPRPRLQRQLDCKTAFVLGYHEHGNCQWALSGEQHPDQWDSVSVAGIYWVPTDVAKDMCEDYVAKDMCEDYARRAVEEYTKWCNGECFGYQIELDDEEIDSCWGYIGNEYFMEVVAEAMTDVIERGEVAEIQIIGEAKYMADYHDLPEVEYSA